MYLQSCPSSLKPFIFVHLRFVKSRFALFWFPCKRRHVAAAAGPKSVQFVWEGNLKIALGQFTLGAGNVEDVALMTPVQSQNSGGVDGD